MASSTFNPHPPPPKPSSTHFPKTPHLLAPTLQTPPKTLTQQDPKLIITGGATLSGHVPISGSKNSALPILAATLCCSGQTKLKNVPNLSDTRSMLSILGSLGAEVEVFGDDVVVSTDGVRSVEPCEGEIGKIRGGFLVIGPLLGRFGEAVVGLPGGCDIGARPVDLHIRGLRALGASVECRDGKVIAHASNGKGLVGGRFRLDYPSVGATETLMMAACAGTDKLLIKGRRKLHDSEYSIIPDRIEAGTFMLAAAITRSCITMSPIVPSHLSCLINKLLHQFSAVPAKSRDGLHGFDVRTSPFPGFPTDLQPQTMALLTTCQGLSVVEESVFENRMNHVTEMQKFGPRIQVCGSTALVFGKDSGRLYGSRVAASDLRGGVSLVLAGLAAQGTTEVNGIAHVDRGYENFEMKLRLLGADVKRLTIPP
ncbi:hypothetical protein RHGRI_009669 [Rhododendron griersonianum]|uniref:UDP-N-acetylglucosamine 1-carboxyvinyltransferase n=1 Tax=Rhododendron griersonianum TaxID=479676 RepID=A0AAV6KFM1_9ERIC|nr:hypothetical protein RHGRI_009669 [Rhododendron griersonianum]